MQELLIRPGPRFADRGDAGRALAAELEGERGSELVVVGLARGGVEVAAEVAHVLAAPLGLVAVRMSAIRCSPSTGSGR
jgi:putative phosphoribosyl transferase